MTAGTLLAVRVMVQDVWDAVTLELPADTSLAELKRRALERVHVPRDPALYDVKFRGALLQPEERTLGELGVVPNAALIILPRRRRAVR